MSVVLPYSIMFKTFVKKPTIMRQTKKKKNEESFKLFTKPRREMAITIKKKKSDRPFFRKSISSVYQEKKKKNDLMSLSTPVKKQVLEDILNSRFLRRKFKKEPTEFSIFFLRTRTYSHLTNIRFTCLSFFAFG